VSAKGKPLQGAAKASFVRKSKRDTCESKAVSAAGRFTARPRIASHSVTQADYALRLLKDRVSGLFSRLTELE
jgi:hypothetical protein